MTNPFRPRRRLRAVPTPPQALLGVVQPPAAPPDDAAPVVPVALVPDDLDEITKDELIDLAEQVGVASYGTKQAIAGRIRDKQQGD